MIRYVHCVVKSDHKATSKCPLTSCGRVLWGVYTIQQTSSNSRVFWIQLLKICWTFAGSCKHPINCIRAITPASVSVLLRCTIPSSDDPPAVLWDADATTLRLAAFRSGNNNERSQLLWQVGNNACIISRLQYIGLWTQVVVLYRIDTIWIFEYLVGP